MSVEVATSPTFTGAVPKFVFKLPGPLGGNLGNISRDGHDLSLQSTSPPEGRDDVRSRTRSCSPAPRSVFARSSGSAVRTAQTTSSAPSPAPASSRALLYELCRRPPRRRGSRIRPRSSAGGGERYRPHQDGLLDSQRLRRWALRRVDARMTNSGRSIIVSGAGGTREPRIPSAMRAAPSPIRRLC